MSKLNPQKASAYVGPGVLRKGGKITPVPNGPLIKKKGIYAGSTLKAGGKIKKAQGGLNLVDVTPKSKNDTIAQKPKPVWVRNPTGGGGSPYVKIAKKMDKKKAGGMIKRADGSYSKRGLWDNIRANKGSGKKPTKQMLVQEKKIKAKSKK